MPLFEVETENHIVITWAEDGDAASAVVGDAYPQEHVMRLTKRPRDTWVISKSALGIAGKMDRTVVRIFKKWGFAWGGDWNYTDPMHFELASLVSAKPR